MMTPDFGSWCRWPNLAQEDYPRGNLSPPAAPCNRISPKCFMRPRDSNSISYAALGPTGRQKGQSETKLRQNCCTAIFVSWPMLGSFSGTAPTYLNK